MRGTEQDLFAGGGHLKRGFRVTRTRSDSGHDGRLNIERHSADIILRVFGSFIEIRCFIIQFSPIKGAAYKQNTPTFRLENLKRRARKDCFYGEGG